jgi:tripartite ATP-independent transporter DctP family solute receptor
MRSKIIFKMFLVLMIVIFFVTGSSAQKTTTLSLCHMATKEDVEGQAFDFFADSVKEKTNGEIEIIVYPSLQLGDYPTQIDNTILGSQDIMVIAESPFSRFDPIFDVTTTPYLITDEAKFLKMLHGPFGEKQSKIFEEKGLFILNTARNMFRPNRVIVSKKPIRSLEDVKGLKIRTAEVVVYSESWKRLGANPVIIPWNETYLALNQNIVEAATGPIALIWGTKWTEIAKYVTFTNEYVSNLIFGMNRKKFDSLSLENQQILVECANSAGDYLASIIDDAVEQDMKKMKEEHGAEFITMDTTPFTNHLRDYYYELEESGVLPPGIVDEVFHSNE